MTSPREARSLLNSVEETRTKTREVLDPSYFDIGFLLVAQSAAVLVAIGHTTDPAREIVVPVLIAAGLGLCGVMTFRASARLGARLGVRAHRRTDRSLRGRCHHQLRRTRARRVGRSGDRPRCRLDRSRHHHAQGHDARVRLGLLPFPARRQALDWHAGLAFGLLAVYLALIVFAFRKDIFGKS